MALNLSDISSSRKNVPPKIVVYGGVKIGKSTFASEAVSPIFLCTEEGVDALDVQRFPLAKSFDDVMSGIELLYAEDHDFKTLVIDSLDWLEPLIWNQLCEGHNVKSIEDVGGGFGKGYIEAEKLWMAFLNGLDALRQNKKMSVILISHEHQVQVTPPDVEPYSSYTLKLHKRATALVKEWADIIGFANQETFTKEDGAGLKKSTRAFTSDSRVLKLDKNPAYLAGSRYRLPGQVKLNYDALMNALVETTEKGGEEK